MGLNGPSENQDMNILLDQLYDCLTDDFETVDSLMENLLRFASDILKLEQGRQAILCTKSGYNYGNNFRDGDKFKLGVWVDYLDEKGPGQWVMFEHWLLNYKNYKEESARQALKSVEIFGLQKTTAMANRFRIHLAYGLRHNLFTETDVHKANKIYEAKIR